MSTTISIRVDGVRQILKQLVDEPIHAKPWTDALTEAVDIMFAAVQQRAPRDTGTLAKSITSKIQDKPVPTWGRVRFPNRVKKGGKKGKGFRYGGALEGSSKFHYRSGSFAGSRTQGWFSGAKNTVATKIDGLLAKAAGEMQARWGKR